MSFPVVVIDVFLLSVQSIMEILSCEYFLFSNHHTHVFGKKKEKKYKRNYFYISSKGNLISKIG